MRNIYYQMSRSILTWLMLITVAFLYIYSGSYFIYEYKNEKNYLFYFGIAMILLLLPLSRLLLRSSIIIY